MNRNGEKVKSTELNFPGEWTFPKPPIVPPVYSGTISKRDICTLARRGGCDEIPVVNYKESQDDSLTEVVAADGATWAPAEGAATAAVEEAPSKEAATAAVREAPAKEVARAAVGGGGQGSCDGKARPLLGRDKEPDAGVLGGGPGQASCDGRVE